MLEVSSRVPTEFSGSAPHHSDVLRDAPGVLIVSVASPTIHILRRVARPLMHILVLPDAGHDDIDENGQEGVIHD